LRWGLAMRCVETQCEYEDEQGPHGCQVEQQMRRRFSELHLRFAELGEGR
jgi:hypothetical protein